MEEGRNASIFEFLRRAAEEKGARYLLIGGHAVNVYGYSRQTADLDLLVCKSAQGLWKNLLLNAGYSLIHEHENFLQFLPGARFPWPLDLMLTRAETFQKMLAASQLRLLYGAEVAVPSIEHLIALKLHALKQNLSHRTLKDFMDVVGLVEANQLDLRGAALQEIFNKFGTEDLYERIRHACGQ